MKRATALKYSAEIARRVTEVGGVILTPRGGYEGILVKRMWIFGSTVKGCETPNDLDLLVHYDNYGARQRWQDVGFDKAYFTGHGLYRTRPSISEALKWLTKGMRKVSRHTTCSDETVFDLKVSIYPTYRMPLTSSRA